ncbi:hypothetical protein [Acutalibacter sp. 1XD8-36]|uniref:hypothetical protein n=1 Tax=Acutalibacter sp. 1XD8-36 TaxID=2320852 RepID=UPI0014130802|nr:hypothetical protein [Acutalibacter sp. 1XD8-36]NBJ88530.1 hypothetical protein [Acutalibacter sp. 1XD8-36]
MKRFLTFTQRKILKDYWREQTPFTLGDLIEKKILHFPALGRLTLRLMESKGQVLAYDRRDGEALYIGTTDSADEWAKIWRKDSNPAAMDECFGGSLRGMNKYEKEEQLAKLDEIILEYAQRKDNRETKDCAIMARGRIIPLYPTRK